jgi:hypothetical protein
MALSAKVSVPVAAPVAAGVKVTPTVQLAPAAMPVPHILLTMANGPPAGTEMPVNASAALKRLVTVTVAGALVLPTASEPKLRLAEESVTGEAPLGAIFFRGQSPRELGWNVHFQRDEIRRHPVLNRFGVGLAGESACRTL